MGNRMASLGQFEPLECVTCGVIFGLPLGYADFRRADALTFYCPNGHSMSWRETEADKIRRERDSLKQQTARLEQDLTDALLHAGLAESRAAAAEKKSKKLIARAKAGVCPCCNRSFVELQRHMKTQHPSFEGENIVALKGGKKS